MYLVDYTGFGPEDRQWTPWVEGCQSAVVDFYEKEFLHLTYRTKEYVRRSGRISRDVFNDAADQISNVKGKVGNSNSTKLAKAYRKLKQKVVKERKNVKRY